MHQLLLTILTTNGITLPTTIHNADQTITTFVSISNRHLTVNITSAQDVEQDSYHPDNQIPSKDVTPGFKPFSIVGIGVDT